MQKNHPVKKEQKYLKKNEESSQHAKSAKKHNVIKNNPVPENPVLLKPCPGNMQVTEKPLPGNQTVFRKPTGNMPFKEMLTPLPIQPKLKTGSPGDKFEEEADRISKEVMQKPEPEKEEGADPVKVKHRVMDNAGQYPEISSEIEKVIKQKQGKGKQLDPGIRSAMEQGFNTDFSNVRIHDDRAAGVLNQSLGAKAFTLGSDVFFKHGEYNPGNFSGKGLIAHELAHVVQQGNLVEKMIQGQLGLESSHLQEQSTKPVKQRKTGRKKVQKVSWKKLKQRYKRISNLMENIDRNYMNVLLPDFMDITKEARMYDPEQKQGPVTHFEINELKARKYFLSIRDTIIQTENYKAEMLFLFLEALKNNLKYIKEVLYYIIKTITNSFISNSAESIIAFIKNELDQPVAIVMSTQFVKFGQEMELKKREEKRKIRKETKPAEQSPIDTVSLFLKKYPPKSNNRFELMHYGRLFSQLLSTDRQITLEFKGLELNENQIQNILDSLAETSYDLYKQALYGGYTVQFLAASGMLGFSGHHAEGQGFFPGFLIGYYEGSHEKEKPKETDYSFVDYVLFALNFSLGTQWGFFLQLKDTILSIVSLFTKEFWTGLYSFIMEESTRYQVGVELGIKTADEEKAITKNVDAGDAGWRAGLIFGRIVFEIVISLLTGAALQLLKARYPLLIAKAEKYIANNPAVKAAKVLSIAVKTLETIRKTIQRLWQKIRSISSHGKMSNFVEKYSKKLDLLEAKSNQLAARVEKGIESPELEAEINDLNKQLEKIDSEIDAAYNKIKKQTDIEEIPVEPEAPAAKQPETPVVEPEAPVVKEPETPVVEPEIPAKAKGPEKKPPVSTGEIDIPEGITPPKAKKTPKRKKVPPKKTKRKTKKTLKKARKKASKEIERIEQTYPDTIKDTEFQNELASLKKMADNETIEIDVLNTRIKELESKIKAYRLEQFRLKYEPLKRQADELELKLKEKLAALEEAEKNVSKYLEQYNLRIDASRRLLDRLKGAPDIVYKETRKELEGLKKERAALTKKRKDLLEEVIKSGREHNEKLREARHFDPEARKRSDNYEYSDFGEIDPCFPPGTIVKTPEGDKRIENLFKGDLVYSFNKEKNKVIICPITMLIVSKTYRLITIDLGPEQITSTCLHRFWVHNEEAWIPAKELSHGLNLVSLMNKQFRIKYKETIKAFTPTYNLEVYGAHNFFVGRTGILVHNGNKPSNFEDFGEKDRIIYGIELVDEPDKIIYIGQTEAEGKKKRFQKHISQKEMTESEFRAIFDEIPESEKDRILKKIFGSKKIPWRDIKEKIKIKVLKRGSWTTFVATVWEKHFYEKFKKAGAPLVNKAKTFILKEKFNLFKFRHLICPD